MADLRIVDAPEIPTANITGQERLPTGGSGNYSISLDSVADYTKTKKDLADNTSVDGKVNGVRQELNTHIEDSLNPHQVTKSQIGLGNVDNTADLDKPVSNSTQAAIISAVTPKADKTYVDSQLALKADKNDVESSLLTKADKIYVDNQLTLKADKTEIVEQLLLKSDKTYVDSALLTKADKTYTDNQLTLKADKTYVDSQDSLLQSQINQKATAEYLDNALTEQTNTVNTALSNLSTVANKFYPTLAEANADIANIAVNQPVSIGEVANGGLWYKATAEATTLTKNPYDPLTQAKADATTKANAAEANAKSYTDAAKSEAIATADNNADIKISTALNKSSGTFDTFAALELSTLINGAFALVANDTDPTKNGHYKKVAGVWTKTSYNPPREITYKYDNLGNLLHRFTPKVVGKAVTYTGAVVTGANYEARILPVVEGDLMYLLNSIGSINGAQGSEWKFYASNPFETETPRINPTTYSSSQYQGKAFLKVVVPEGATKLVLNTKYNGQVIDWSVRKDAPSTSYALSKYTIVDIDGIDVSPSISPLELKRIRIFGDEVIPTNTVDTIIKETGALVESSIEVSAKVSTIADIILGGTNAARRDNTTSAVVRPNLDLSGTDMVLIMVGSNDAPIISNGDLSFIPLNPTTNSWNDLQKFPNTFVGNLALIIERLQGLYPKMVIKLFSPPYVNLTGKDKSVIESLLPAMQIVANYYSVEFINTTYSSGLSYRFMSAAANKYSIDGKILSTQGAEILNKFILKSII